MPTMSKTISFLTLEQLNYMAENLAGSCNALTTYFDRYQEEYGFTDMEMDTLDELLAEALEQELEMYLCPTCGWWTHQGETMYEGEQGEDVCSDCYEEQEDND